MSHLETVVWPPKSGTQSPQKHAPLCLWRAAELARASTSRPPSWWSFPHEDASKRQVSREQQRRLAAKGSSSSRSSMRPATLLLIALWCFDHSVCFFSNPYSTFTCWPVAPETRWWECPANSLDHSRESPCRGAAGRGLAGHSVIHSGPRSPAFPSRAIPEKSWRASPPDRKYHNRRYLRREPACLFTVPLPYPWINSPENGITCGFQFWTHLFCQEFDAWRGITHSLWFPALQTPSLFQNLNYRWNQVF